MPYDSIHFVSSYLGAAGRETFVTMKPTRGLEVDLDGERFSLRNQGAQDISRYESYCQKLVTEVSGGAFG